MNKFELHILGCGSALPTMKHVPSAQVLNIREKLFLIDCGEGTQLEFRRARLSFGRLSHIFISHLHGDHCFGLIGLISTLGLLGRTGNLTIHAVAELEEVLRPQLNFFCQGMSYKVIIESFDPTKNEVIYEDRSVKVSTIPLDHRMPCAGFLFEEADYDLNLKSDMIRFYDIPVKDLPDIKKGKDFIMASGEVIPNSRLTHPKVHARKYAYCSDTAYKEDIVPIIKDADLLYHEATFLEDNAARAQITRHSTARQAATIAKMANVKKLMIGHYSSRYDDDSLFKKEAQEIFPHVILANEAIVEKL
ncbi:ribonuclease Z [Dysgonomonas macrotermitis]|uniref:Ribonuclease Z n=1 Tax=Dysgonomonas macrotermitis TaxID=1346286 RepID=A0A1M5D8F2_9BACT|nr:ribonuclease Z [Dysgonomonas macrotermitis]SHF63167.1 ribonuclease Z [Dysgonomonas macrotermitis]